MVRLSTLARTGLFAFGAVSMFACGQQPEERDSDFDRFMSNPDEINEETADYHLSGDFNEVETAFQTMAIADGLKDIGEDLLNGAAKNEAYCKKIKGVYYKGDQYLKKARTIALSTKAPVLIQPKVQKKILKFALIFQTQIGGAYAVASDPKEKKLLEQLNKEFAESVYNFEKAVATADFKLMSKTLDFLHNDYRKDFRTLIGMQCGWGVESKF